MSLEAAKQLRSDYLAPSGSILVGAGSIFNLAGSYFDYNTSASAPEADRRGLEHDWKQIGQDLRAGIDAARAENGGLRRDQ